MSSDRTLAVILGAPLLCALVFSWASLVLELDDVPADADYTAVRALLDRDHFNRGTDALAILPPWSLRPLQALGDLDPISSDALATQPLHRFARLFVVVEPDAGPELPGLLARLGPPAARERSGRVELLRFSLPAPTVAFDLRAQLARAQVRILGPAGDLACDVPTQTGVSRTVGFSCPTRPAWQRVTRAWMHVSENGDDAVWSHPPPRGERLEIAWSDVPIGSAVVVRAGHLREGADQARAPVRLQVEIDGERVGTVLRAPAFSFRTDVIDTARFAGKRARLALVIDSDNEASNHFAWDAVVLAAGATP